MSYFDKDINLSKHINDSLKNDIPLVYVDADGKETVIHEINVEANAHTK